MKLGVVERESEDGVVLLLLLLLLLLHVEEVQRGAMRAWWRYGVGLNETRGRRLSAFVRSLDLQFL